MNGKNILRNQRILSASLAVLGVCTISVAESAATASSAKCSLLVTTPSPYAQYVVETSNEGLEGGLVDTSAIGGSTFEPPSSLVAERCGGGGGLPDIPDISTTGLLCQWLTLQPAQGCLETQLSGCTTQSHCTSAVDNCTNGDYCTHAVQCTNTTGCTDAGVCTQENGCTGTEHCTESAGCTQGASCTNGSLCTQDAGTCTGGAACTQGTGCTNGDNCTGGTGCTADSQCTSGPTCTANNGGSGCTNGDACTAGASCGPQEASGDGLGHKQPVVRPGALASLDEVGLPDPNLDPHLAPRESMAGLGWFALLIVPGFLFLRRSTDTPN